MSLKFITNTINRFQKITATILSQFLSQRKSYERRFHSIIEEGISNGELKALSSKVILLTLLNAVRWLHFANKQYSTNKAVEQLKDDISTLLLRGITS